MSRLKAAHKRCITIRPLSPTTLLHHSATVADNTVSPLGHCCRQHCSATRPLSPTTLHHYSAIVADNTAAPLDLCCQQHCFTTRPLSPTTLFHQSASVADNNATPLGQCCRYLLLRHGLDSMVRSVTSFCGSGIHYATQGIEIKTAAKSRLIRDSQQSDNTGRSTLITTT